LEGVVGIMFFKWTIHATILFDWWKTTTWYYYLISCIVVSAMTVFLELLRFFYHRIAHDPKRQLKWSRRSGEALLYGVYIVMSYLVMLIVMTYNVGLCMSILIGYIVGHFLFPRGALGHSPDKDRPMYAPVETSIGCHWSRMLLGVQSSDSSFHHMGTFIGYRSSWGMYGFPTYCFLPHQSPKQVICTLRPNGKNAAST